MSTGDDSKELNGLARSIDALFNQEGDDELASHAPDSMDALMKPQGQSQEQDAEAGGSEAASAGPAPEGAAPAAEDAASDAEDVAPEVEEAAPELEDAAPVVDDADAAADEPASEEPSADATVTPAPTGDEMVWEEVQEAATPVGPPDPDALAEAVEAFLSSPPLAREGQGHALREAALACREANQLDPLARAAERLALGSGDPPDEACVAMAQSLVSAGVASRLVAMLGAAREEERRAELMRVCHLLGHEMALAVADALSDTTDRFARRTFLECIVGMGETAMPVVEEMAEDNRWFVVRNAVSILGDVGGERAVELITATLAHTDARVRKEALLALAKVGGEDAGMLVHGMLEDPDADVRLAAAMAAGELKVERALRPLLSILENENDPDVVIGILRALGRLGDPGAVQLIEKRAVASFFSKPPAEVRIAAYRALQNIGTPHAKELIEAAKDDKDPEVKAAVRQMTR